MFNYRIYDTTIPSPPSPPSPHHHHHHHLYEDGDKSLIMIYVANLAKIIYYVCTYILDYVARIHNYTR